MADFSFILPRLATGGAINGPADVDLLAKAGVNLIINARAEFDDAPFLGGHPEIAYVWDGCSDDGQPKPVEWFSKALDVALPAYAKPHVKIFYHCQGGSNRGPSLCYAHMRAIGFDAATAHRLITAFRPPDGLRYAPDADAAIIALGYA